MFFSHWRLENSPAITQILQLNFACFLRDLFPSIIILLSLNSILLLLQFLIKILHELMMHVKEMLTKGKGELNYLAALINLSKRLKTRGARYLEYPKKGGTNRMQKRVLPGDKGL